MDRKELETYMHTVVNIVERICATSFKTCSVELKFISVEYGDVVVPRPSILIKIDNKTMKEE